GARCVNRARRDLCGGYPVTGIPTATELLERVTFYYDLYIRDMLIRNLEKGQSLVDNGVLDWDLDINR
ncbi:hypothetical protein ACI8ED_027185, partial [Klebsiella pneumoniae]